jgi:hypothetical protein
LIDRSYVAALSKRQAHERFFLAWRMQSAATVRRAPQDQQMKVLLPW